MLNYIIYAHIHILKNVLCCFVYVVKKCKRKVQCSASISANALNCGKCILPLKKSRKKNQD